MRDTVSFGKFQLPRDVTFGVVDKQVGKGWHIRAWAGASEVLANDGACRARLVRVR